MELSFSLEAGDLHFRNLSPPPPQSLFWVALFGQSVSQFRQFPHLNYWSFAQHAPD